MKHFIPTFIFFFSFFFPLVSHATFSIVAVDPETGEIGSAGASCIGGVDIIAGIVPGLGAMNSQAWACVPNVNLNNGLEQMKLGKSPEEILDYVKANDECFAGNYSSSYRQYGIALFDSLGNPQTGAFTGSNADDWKGHITGPNYAIQGNILLGPEVLDQMEQGFLNTEGNLAEKLMAAMQGANIPGADSRCLEEGVSTLSIYLRVAKPDDLSDNLYLDLNIPTLPTGVEPIDTLQTLFDIWIEGGVLPCGLPDLSTDTFCDAEQLCPINASPILPDAYKDGYDNYTYVQRGDIRLPILSQSFLSDEQVLFTKEVFSFYLQDVPNTQYGADKSNIWRYLLNNQQVIALHSSGNGINAAQPSSSCSNFQNLIASDIQIPGSANYLTAKQSRLFQKIAYPIYSQGIRRGNKAMYDAIVTSAEMAIANEIYTPLSNSLSFEEQVSNYWGLATSIFYGQWAHDPRNNGMAGISELAYISREEMSTKDPDLYEIISNFYSPYIDFSIPLASSFKGHFLLTIDTEQPYTYQSQYLQHIQLTGSNHAGISGNTLDNELIGNEGDNLLMGNGGNDLLDGMAGMDSAKYQGNFAEYTLTMEGDYWLVADGQADRDGMDTLRNIEFITFADSTYSTSFSVGTSSPTILHHSLQAFPNPSQDVLQLQYPTSNDYEEVSVTIYPLNGQAIFQQMLPSTKGLLRVNISALVSGIYVLKVEVNGKTFLAKLVISKEK